MIKKILKAVKRVIVAVLVIYGYNLIAAPLNLILPINFITILIVSILGIPSMFALIMLMLFVF